MRRDSTGPDLRDDVGETAAQRVAGTLDRRRFLQVAAATGIAAAWTAAGYRWVLGQEASPAAADVPDVVTVMAASLGHDLEAILRFVQEEIRYEPYPGILRDGNGTLVARAGNSADQALLLAEMLAASGIPVRFALGPLDDASVTALMRTTVTDPDTARERTWQALLSDDDVERGIEWTLPADLSATEAADVLDLSRFRTALEEDRQGLRTRVAEHATSSIETIQAALATAGIVPTAGTTQMPALERTQHVWVQAHDGSSWQDLDPSFVGSPSGQAVGTISETLEALPAELRHRVDFAVIAETFLGGALTQEAILQASAYADQLAYSGLILSHAPAASLPSIDLIGSGLGEGTEYNAILVSGSKTLVGPRSISFGSGTGSQLLDAFGGGGDEGLIDGETSAEWLEVSVTSPGAETVVARRTIFDRLGYDIRASGNIDPYAIPRAEFIDLGDGAGAQFLPTRMVHALFVSGAAPNLKMLIQELGIDVRSGASIVPGALEGTRALLEAELADSMGSIGFYDAPAIQAVVMEPTPTGVSVVLDILHRSFGSLGLTSAQPVAPPAMIAGVIAHAVERATVDAGEVPPDGRTVASVGAVFELAAAQGIPTQAYAGSLPPEATYTPEHSALIQRALDAGQVVIAPATAVDLDGRTRLGMWLVDPVSGAAVDQMDDGRGAVEPATVYVVMPSGVLVSTQLFGPHMIRIYQQNGIAISSLTGQLARASNMLDRVAARAALEFQLKQPYIPAPWN